LDFVELQLLAEYDLGGRFMVLEFDKVQILRPQSGGFIDFLLLDAKGFPFIVLEGIWTLVSLITLYKRYNK